MNILILGGTGAMGTHIVEILSGEGHSVTVSSRSRHPDKPGVHYVWGDAHADDFLSPLLKERQWDAIIDFMVYKTEEFQKKALLLLTNTEHYVFLSSARVYANCSSLLTEESPRLLDIATDDDFLSTDEYALGKARQEDLLRNNYHTNWTIIRPYITYSQNRLQLGIMEKEAWLYRALHQRPIVFFEDVAEKVTTMTYGQDVAKAIALLVGNRAAQGETFHITTSESLTWQEVLSVYCDTIEECIGPRPLVCWMKNALNSKIPAAPIPLKYDRLFNRRFDNSKIIKACPSLSFLPVREGLAACLRQFLEHPRFLHVSYGMEALRDKVTGCQTSLSEIARRQDKLKYLLFRYSPIALPLHPIITHKK